jgi:hypothetical protein
MEYMAFLPYCTGEFDVVVFLTSRPSWGTEESKLTGHVIISVNELFQAIRPMFNGR